MKTKFITCLVCIMSSFFSMSFAKAPNLVAVNFKDETVGPLTKSSNLKDVTLHYSIFAKKPVFDMQEIVTIYTEKVDIRNIVYKKAMPSHHARTGQEYSFSFDFDGFHAFGQRNLAIIDVQIWSVGSGRIFSSQQVNLYPYKSYTKYSEEEARDYLMIGEPGFLNLAKNNGYLEETFDFTSFPMYFADAPYHYLDTSNVEFYYDSNCKFVCDEAYITFQDKYELFTSFEGYNFTRKIDLVLKQVGNKVMVSFPLMYVNPTSLEMSQYHQPGYLETYKLFMPLNHRDKFIDTKWIIHINGAGYSMFDITMTLDYFPSDSLIGNCANSDYCVTGGVKND